MSHKYLARSAHVRSSTPCSWVREGEKHKANTHPSMSQAACVKPSRSTVQWNRYQMHRLRRAKTLALCRERWRFLTSGVANNYGCAPAQRSPSECTVHRTCHTITDIEHKQVTRRRWFSVGVGEHSASASAGRGEAHTTLTNWDELLHDAASEQVGEEPDGSEDAVDYTPEELNHVIKQVRQSTKPAFPASVENQQVGHIHATTTSWLVDVDCDVGCLALFRYELLCPCFWLAILCPLLRDTDVTKPETWTRIKCGLFRTHSKLHER